MRFLTKDNNMNLQELQKLMNQKKKLKNADIKQVTLQIGTESLTIDIKMNSNHIKTLILEELRCRFGMLIDLINDKFDKGE